jgi:hypothetical protein
MLMHFNMRLTTVPTVLQAQHCCSVSKHVMNVDGKCCALHKAGPAFATALACGVVGESMTAVAW